MTPRESADRAATLKLVMTKRFWRQLGKVRRRGTEAGVVYNQVVDAIHAWRLGRSADLKMTNKGAGKIPHAVKYDLQFAWRLLTIEHANMRVLMWLDDHDAMIRWVQDREGYEFVMSEAMPTPMFIPTDNSPKRTVAQLAEATESAPVSRRKGRIFRDLPKSLLEALNLPDITIRALNLVAHEDLDEDAAGMWALIDGQVYADLDQKQAVIQIVDLLHRGAPEEALRRAELYVGEATKDLRALDVAVQARAASSEFCDLASDAANDLEYRFRNGNFVEWLLFLHPKQQKFVDAEYNGPARLLGVSGSGKTCVLAHRARLLATRYPGEKIMVLVLNAALKTLVENLLEALCPTERRAQISVMRMHDYCEQVVRCFDPGRKIEQYDPDSREDIAATWRDFSEKSHAVRLMDPLRGPLEGHNVDPWAYMHDELIWIRSGFGSTQEDRQQYLICDRHGRGLPFPRATPSQKIVESTRGFAAFPADTRVRVLALLGAYEDYMRAGGMLDEDGVALSAFFLRKRMLGEEPLRARCVLLDEVQDWSTNQLAIAALVPTDLRDGLFLAGDPVQKVFPRQHSLSSAGIDIRGRGHTLLENYRNSYEILQAAFEIIKAFMGNCPVSDDEILRPQYAARRGPTPKLVICETRDEQYRCVESMADILRSDAGSQETLCVASARPMVASAPPVPFGQVPAQAPSIDRYLAEVCKRRGWPIKSLEEPWKLADLASHVVTARFEEVKGYEFFAVFLTDLSDEGLLTKAIPKDEEWRIAFQLYVAMTRAQEELWLFCVGQPSRLLQPLINAGVVDLTSPSEIRY